MKKSLVMLTLAALSGLWASDAWGWDTHSTHTGTITATSLGNGTVYVADNSAATSGSSSGSVDCGGAESGDNKTKDYWLFATANASYHFKGWSESETGAIVSTDNPLKYTIRVNDNATRYASFEKNPASTISFVQPTCGSYSITVGGETKSDYASFETSDELTLTATPSSGYRVYGWYTEDGGVRTYFAYGATAKYVAMSSVTIGIEFMAESEVAKVVDYDGLVSALSTDAKVVEISNGSTVVVPNEATLTVPAGKQLIVDGTLTVVGSLICNGSASGNIEKVVLNLKQDELIKTDCAEATYDPSSLAQLNYYKSELVDVNSEVKGATASKEVLIVTRNGEQITSTSWDVGSKPKALYCTNDKTVAINCITGVSEHVAKPEDKQETNNPGAWWSGSNVAVLLSDWTLSYKDKTASAGQYIGYVDCCQKYTISHSVEVSSLNIRTVNAKKVSFTGKTTNLKIWYVNCAAFKTKFPDTDSSGSPTFHFYDCPAAKAGSSNQDGTAYPSSWMKNARAHFYSGSFPNATLTTGKCIVHGGTFKSNPNACIENTSIEAYQDSTSSWVVQKKIKTKPVIGTTEYDTLAAAVAAVPEGGVTPTTIKLVADLTLASDLIIPAGKNVTIELDGASISGSRIVNNGTLKIEDSNPNDTKGTVSSSVENNGKLEITYGTYTGNFTLNDGSRLITHNGKFTGTISTVADPLSVAELRGGNFKQTDIGDFLDAEAGYVMTSYDGGYSVGKSPADYAEVSVNNSGSTPVYTIKVLSDSNLTIYKKGVDRSSYADEQWYAKAELLSALSPYLSRTVDIVISFDRAVSAESIIAKITQPYTFSKEIDRAVKQGEEYRILSEKVADMGYYQLQYASFLIGDYTTLVCTASNNGGLDNIGTAISFGIVLCTGAHTGNPERRADLSDLKTVYTVVSRSFKFTGKGAIAGGTDYTSLSAALSAVDYSGTVKLSKDCAEQVVVGKACSFTLDANNFAFTGEIKGDESKNLYVKRNGDVWTVFEKATEAPVEVKTADDETKVAAVEVEKSWEEQVVKDSGVQDPTPEQKQELVQEALQKTEDNGLKVWENKLLEQAEAKQAPIETGFAKVNKEEVTVNDKQVVATEVKGSVDGSNLANLETGTYQQTIVVKDAKGEEVAIADPEATAKSVVKNDSTEKTVVLAIPGEVTVASAIATTPQAGDQIKVYDTEIGGYRCWKYENLVWTAVPTVVNGKEIDNPTAAADKSLLAGSVILYERKEDSGSPAPVTVVTDYTKDLVSEPIEVPTATDGSDPKWNLMANPTGREYDLNKIIKTANLDKIVVLPKEGLGQTTYEKGSDNKWGYYKTETYQKPSGKMGSRRVWVGSDEKAPVVKGGQSMWYISNGGKPKIEWNK